MVAGGHNDHVSFYHTFPTRTALRNTLGTMIETDAIFRKADDISTKPFGSPCADLMEDIGIHHWGLREKALGLRCQIGQVTVKEYAEDVFGDPRKKCLLSKNIESEQHINKSIPWNDPFFGAGKNVCGLSSSVDDEFKGFNC